MRVWRVITVKIRGVSVQQEYSSWGLVNGTGRLKKARDSIYTSVIFKAIIDFHREFLC